MKHTKAGGTIRVKWKTARTSNDQKPWQVPKRLYPLRDWLAERGVDVTSLESYEHTLRLALNLSGVSITKPKWFQMDQALYSLQKQLTEAPHSPSDLAE